MLYWELRQRLKGKSDRVEYIRDIVFSAARYNAANTAMSSDASKAISQHKFPWEQKKQEQQHISPDDKIEAFLRREDKRLNRNGRP